MFTNHWTLFLFIGFCFIVAVQLFYYWFFFARLVFYKKKDTEELNHTNPVSIIICARDESQNLLKNLPSILAQNYATTHELIVVNDNSFDDTGYILTEFQKTYKHINVITLNEQAKFVQGKKFPLSIGIKAAKYELLVLTDADCTPATNEWLQSMQAQFAPHIDIVLGYGAYKKRKGLLNKWIRFETFHTALQYLSYSLAKVPYMGVGRNLAYKKTAFTNAKGFTSHNHIPSGDDDLFVNAAATSTNCTININPNSFTYSTPKSTWSSWIKQKNRHFSTSKYYKPVHKLLLGLYSVAQFLMYPLFVLALVFCPWQIVLIIFGVRIVSLAVVWLGAMHKLKEHDLKPWFLLFDIALFFYMLTFAPSLFKKTKTGWN